MATDVAYTLLLLLRQEAVYFPSTDIIADAVVRDIDQNVKILKRQFLDSVIFDFAFVRQEIERNIIL